MPKDAKGNDVSVPELAEDTGKKAQNIAKKEGAGRPATPEYNADRVRRAAQGSALNEAGLSFEDVKGDDGGYLYKLNPDKSVTIVYDPTGRASGVTLTPGTRQRTAYEAILKNVYEMEPPSAPAKAPRVSPKRVAAPEENQSFMSEAESDPYGTSEDVPLSEARKATKPAPNPRTGETLKGWKPDMRSPAEEAIAAPAVGTLASMLEREAQRTGKPVSNVSPAMRLMLSGTQDSGELKKMVDSGVISRSLYERLQPGYAESEDVPREEPGESPDAGETAIESPITTLSPNKYAGEALEKAMEARQAERAKNLRSPYQERLGQLADMGLSGQLYRIGNEAAGLDDLPLSEARANIAEEAPAAGASAVAARGADLGQEFALPKSVLVDGKRVPWASAPATAKAEELMKLAYRYMDPEEAARWLQGKNPKSPAGPALPGARGLGRVLGAAGTADLMDTALGLPGAMLGAMGEQQAKATDVTRLVREGAALLRKPTEAEDLTSEAMSALMRTPQAEIDKLFEEGAISNKLYRRLSSR